MLLAIEKPKMKHCRDIVSDLCKFNITSMVSFVSRLACLNANTLRFGSQIGKGE